MRIALLFLTHLAFVWCSCPSGWELVRDGECRGEAQYVNLYYDEAVDKAVSICEGIQGFLATIHNNEHQSYYSTKGSIIGLTCNAHTKLWEWTDGSALDYKPSTYDKELDQDCTTVCGHSSNYFDVWCTTTMEKPEQRDCDNFDNDSEDSVCYQIGTGAANWQDAQMECRQYGANLASIHNSQENNFIRRLAVSKGTVNGLFLGGTILGKGDDYGWIDGSPWDYQNFYPGFPIDGLGDCLSMDTLGVAGQWMNMDCSTQMAVACVRQPNSSYADACSSGPWKEGQIIYSPGYPYDASVPCDYFLTVDAGKKVEVKVHLLEANTCCDHLILTDNYLAGNIVANLTGEISSKTYTTKSSNLMRVSWQPNGGVNVRGFMMSYRAV